MSARTRILLLQPLLRPPGGGETVTAAVLESLVGEYDVTVLTLEPVDIDRVNHFTGSSLRAADFSVRVVSPWIPPLRRLTRIDAALLQRYAILRHARRMIGEFDLAISTNNEIDVGRRAIQYIHFPWGYWPRPDADLRWFHRIPGLLPLYYRLSDRLAPVSAAAIASNRTLVNSDWTGQKFRERYGGETTTVYPPAGGDATVPWDAREDTFVLAARIAEAKEIEKAIEIVERVREGGYDVRLRIIGTPVKRSYAQRIQRLVASRHWATLHLDVSRAELLSILSKARYGLHGMTDEHFGIAPAEAARSGCIVFLPRSGGQVEIVGGDERLTFVSAGDAAAKIGRVLADPAMQRDIRAMLLKRTSMFAPAIFRDRIRAIVAEELERSRRAGDAPRDRTNRASAFDARR